MTKPEILRADCALRRLAVAAIALAIVAGAAGYTALEHWLAGIRELPRPEARAALASALTSSIAGMSALAVAVGVCLWLYGGKVRDAGVFPPPGTRVLRDTSIVRGEAARQRGAALRILGGILVAMALALLVVGLAMVRSLTRA